METLRLGKGFPTARAFNVNGSPNEAEYAVPETIPPEKFGGVSCGGCMAALTVIVTGAVFTEPPIFIA